jgi:enamine deaminase RidA (YjgF/YER057c/UK114 family)
MTIQHIRTAGAPAPGGAYSHGVAAAGLLWTSGFGPQDPVTGEMPEGIHDQTVAVLRNVAAVLATHGLDLSDVVKVTTHLQHLERDFAGYDAAYRTLLSPPFPTRTTVGSDLQGILVEIDVVAALRT